MLEPSVVDRPQRVRVVNLDPRERDRISAALRALPPAHRPSLSRHRELLASLRKAAPVLVAAIEKSRDERSCSALLVRGLPTPNVIHPTPCRPLRDSQHTSAHDLVLAAAGLMGTVYAFAGEKFGSLVHDVYPVKERVDEPSNEGARAPLGMHTEVAAHPLAPHNVLLLCLKGDPRGEAMTTLAHVDDIRDVLPEDVTRMLAREKFQFFAPLSFRQSTFAKRSSVLSNPPDGSSIRLNLNGMRTLDASVQRALESLGHVFARPSVVSTIGLRPGDLLVIDNQHAVHGRTSYRPSFDGRDRWLLRAYARRGLPSSGSDEIVQLPQV